MVMLLLLLVLLPLVGAGWLLLFDKKRAWNIPPAHVQPCSGTGHFSGLKPVFGGGTIKPTHWTCRGPFALYCSADPLHSHFSSYSRLSLWFAGSASNAPKGTWYMKGKVKFFELGHPCSPLLRLFWASF